jgi:hypothetical protein
MNAFKSRGSRNHRATEDVRPFHVFLLFTLAAAAAAGIYLKTVPFTRFLWYLAGALFYLLFFRIRVVDSSRGVDYLQSGEGAVGALVLLLVTRFVTSSPWIAGALVAAAMALYELYIHHSLALNRRELSFSGLLMLLLFLALAFFLLRFDPISSGDTLRPLLLGYWSGLLPGPGALAGIAAAGLALYLFARLAWPQIALLSFGRLYFDGAGYDYSATRVIALVSKGVLVSLVFLLLGWLGGTASYLALSGRRGGVLSDMALLVFAALYTQILSMLVPALTPYGVLSAAVLLSWALLILNERRWKACHDRAP